MGRIIITGGAGFIGTNIVQELNTRGQDDIIIVDRLGSADKWLNLRALRFEDYLDKDDFRYRLQEDTLRDPIDAVIHMGACSDTTETDADYLADNNYRYSRELCQWCLHHGVHFIYASSAATYGNGSLGYSDDDSVIPDLRPLNMYGYSKHIFDLWLLRNRLQDSVVGLKFFNVYGPFEEHKGEMRSVVHKSHGQILKTGRVELFKSYRADYPDGGQIRDFIYVKDAVDVVLHFLADRKTSGIFNCGTGKARSWLDLANSVFKAMKRDPQIDFIAMPEYLRYKYQYHTEADLSKLRAAGYSREFTSIENGIADYVRSHLEPLANEAAAE